MNSVSYKEEKIKEKNKELNINIIKLCGGNILFFNNETQVAKISSDIFGNIDVSSKKLINVSDPSNEQDAVTKKYLDVNLNEHIINKNNPHQVTKIQLGLNNVENIKNNIANIKPTQKDNLSLGYNIMSRWLDTTSKQEYLCVASTLNNSEWINLASQNNNIKDNFTSLVAPQRFDDSLLGYSVGSRWIDNKNKKIYVCLDAALNNSRWEIINNPPGESNFGVNITNIANSEGIYSGKLDSKLKFKSLVGGDNVKLNSTENDIIINSQNSRSFMMAHIPIDCSSLDFSTILYFPWLASEFSKYKNGKLIFQVDVYDRNLDILVYNSTDRVILGSQLDINNSGFYSFLIANPDSDARLEVQMKKSSEGGTDPRIFGIVLTYDT
jgi:hypothetical protein